MAPPVQPAEPIGTPPEGGDEIGQSMDGMGTEPDPVMDGGVDSPDTMMGDDEENVNDPKEEIQKLTGKLSQKLNDYVTQNQDDSETSKYVLSMIAKQASKNMSDDDKKDVIKKLKSSDDDTVEDDGIDGGDMGNDPMEPPISESRMTETFTSAMSVFDSDKEDASRKKRIPVNPRVKRSPFYSNR